MPNETAEDRAAQARNRPEGTANREHAMRNVDPFVGRFVAIAALMATFFVPVFMLLLNNSERLAAIEARMDGFETRMDDLKAAIAMPARDVAANNERMAHLEGTVAGALGRPFPERMAERPDNQPRRGGLTRETVEELALYKTINQY